jgi:hypothetical protein
VLLLLLCHEHFHLQIRMRIGALPFLVLRAMRLYGKAAATYPVGTATPKSKKQNRN